MTETDILKALHEAYKRAGTQGALAKKAGVSQGRIADYLNERCSIGNMTISVFLRLFPNMVVNFFGGKSTTSSPETSTVIGENIVRSLEGVEYTYSHSDGVSFTLRLSKAPYERWAKMDAVEQSNVIAVIFQTLQNQLDVKK